MTMIPLQVPHAMHWPAPRRSWTPHAPHSPSASSRAAPSRPRIGPRIKSTGDGSLSHHPWGPQPIGPPPAGPQAPAQCSASPLPVPPASSTPKGIDLESFVSTRWTHVSPAISLCALVHIRTCHLHALIIPYVGTSKASSACARWSVKDTATGQFLASAARKDHLSQPCVGTGSQREVLKHHGAFASCNHLDQVWKHGQKGRK